MRRLVLLNHLAEEDQAIGNLLLNRGLVDLREEFVPLNLRLLLREPVLALALANDVELPNRLRLAAKLRYVVPIAEEPVAPAAIGPLVDARVLNAHFES